MIINVKFLVVCWALNLTKVESQLTNGILRPAFNVFNSLTGNYFNPDNNNQPSQQSSNVRQFNNRFSASPLSNDYISSDNRNDQNQPRSFNIILAHKRPNQQTPNNQLKLPSYRSISNRQTDVIDEPATSACGGYWSYRNDNNGVTGLVKIPNPSYTQNVLKIGLSLPVRLQLSVSLPN